MSFEIFKGCRREKSAVTCIGLPPFTLLGVFLLLGAGPADAQVARKTATAIEEIVVTARQREESLQTIPLAVTAYSAEELRRRNIRSLYDVAAATAGLNYNEFKVGSLAVPVVRGLSQTQVTSLTNNVAVFLDGVYIGAKFGLNLEMLGLERIEVVKGPQSARYGRGAFAGAINYISQEPSGEFEGDLIASLGTHGRRDIGVSVSGGISENVTGRLSVGYSSFDGTYDNQFELFPGAQPFPEGGGTSNINGSEDTTVSASLAFTPTDSFKLRGNLYYNDNTRDPGAWRYYRNNCGNPHFSGEVRYYCGELPSIGENDLTLDSRAPGIDTESVFANVLAEFTFANDMRLSALFGYNEFEATGYEPNERVQPDESPDNPTTGFRADDGNRYSLEVLRSPISAPRKVDDLSLEVRLQSGQQSALRWEAGAYIASTEYSTETVAWLDRSELPAGVSLVSDPLIFILNPIPGTNGDFARQQLVDDELEQSSVFAGIEYNVTDSLRVGAEIRYAEETISQDPVIDVRPVTDPRLLGRDETFTYTAPRLSADYQFAEDYMLYASVAKGVKPGGFNSRGIDEELTFDPEENWTYEFGLKSSWLDRRVRANVAVFYTDWTDLQFAAPSRIEGLAFNVTQNLAGAESRGVEVEVDAQITPSLRLGGTYSHTVAEFEDDLVDPGLISNCRGSAGCSEQIGGNQLPRYSKNQASAYGEFTSVIGRGELFARADVMYRSKQFVDTANAYWVPERTMVNGKVGYRVDQWEISLWGENLTDEDAPVAAVNAPRSSVFLFLPQAIYADLRRFGVTASYSF